MTIKVGINGFGRIGRLTLRAALAHADSNDNSNLEFVHINDPHCDAATAAHLLNFDSVHGQLPNQASSDNNTLEVQTQSIKLSQASTIDQADWSNCDLVLESSGRFRQIDQLQSYFQQGVKKVVVSAPVNDAGALNIVMGVNDSLYDGSQAIVTAASCTTNCIAPVVKIIQREFGIEHGSITTIHDVTNTQTILDAPHKDLRRARACGMSLIPTTTGSATAITQIFPELKGRLNGHAIRVPLANASLTDCVFELQKKATAESVNQALNKAANGELKGILGFEERPLVSIDYRSDPRSCVVDALSTMVINEQQLKLYLWYDNEWGYANRTLELVMKVANKLDD